MTRALADLLRDLPPAFALIAIGLTVAAESALVIGVFLPGATGLLTLGFLAHLGPTSLSYAMCTGSCAALIGTTTGYLRGQKTGSHNGIRRLAERVAKRPLDPRMVSGPALACGQWVVGVRTLLPRLAGSTGLSYRRFAVWSVPSALTWGSGLVLLGWLAGQSYLVVARWLGWAGGAALIALILAAITIPRIHRAIRRRRKASTAERDLEQDQLTFRARC